MNKSIQIFDYYIVLLMFLISGGAYFYILNGRVFIPIYVISAIYFTIKRNGRRKTIKRNKNSSLYIVLFLVCFFLEYFFINTNHTGDIQPFIYVIFLLCTYYVLSSFTRNQFRDIYLTICSALVIVGVFIYSFVMLGILHPTGVRKGEIIQQICLFHSFGWGSVTDRFMSIYWEPGACQIVLITTFLLYFKEIVSLNIKKAHRWKFAIILLAVFLTQSTAAYINIAVLGMITISKNSFRKKECDTCIVIPIHWFIDCLGLSTSTIITDKYARNKYTYDYGEYKRLKRQQ